MPGVTDTLGRPLRDLRISVTDRCNFRCPYCMPAELFGERYKFLPKKNLLTYEEISRVATVFAELGVRKIRLTGGEPLMRNGLHNLVLMLAAIPGVEDLAMTSNGYLLSDQASALAEAGLHRITVSLDSLADEVFGAMNGRGHGVERVIQGIAAAEEAGLSPVKIDAVVQRNVNDTGIVDLARRFKGTGHIVRFIEYMDVGNINGWRTEQVVPAKEIVQRINAELPIEPIDPNYFGEVAKRWRYLDGEGEIGVITSVTEPFCHSCTRARLSPDGKIFSCLFGTEGCDLREPLRTGATDDDLTALISQTWFKRSDRYSEIRASLNEPIGRKVEMYHIGG